ncbi:hypothetical protein Kisp01_22330 [Kineosporia sp. NBRC 101677]|nr:hypothetical protein Kisp01_22330 [Kineosporia sp. NBRC 101677]
MTATAERRLPRTKPRHSGATRPRPRAFRSAGTGATNGSSEPMATSNRAMPCSVLIAGIPAAAIRSRPDPVTTLVISLVCSHSPQARDRPGRPLARRRVIRASSQVLAAA